MPNRYVREGWLGSERILAAGELAEVLFLRLLLKADDFGRFDGRMTFICRSCWPNGGPGEEDVTNRMQALVAENLVIPYEVDGKPFIYIPNFKQRTRSGKSKYPDPPPIPPTSVRRMTDNARTDDGQVTDACSPRSVSRSRSNSVSVSGSVFSQSINSPKNLQPEHKPETPEGSPKLAPIPPDVRTAIAKAAGPRVKSFRELEAEPASDAIPAGGITPREAPDPPKRPPIAWRDSPDGIDAQAALLGMQREPLESDREFLQRIDARMAL